MRSLEGNPRNPRNPREIEVEKGERKEKMLERKLREIFSIEKFPHQGSVRLSLILSAYPKIRIFLGGIILHTTLR